jgi:DNA-binding response OmpR family regulator
MQSTEIARAEESTLPPPGAASASPCDGGRPAHPTVLVVDDERPIRDLLRDFLEKHEFKVHSVQDGCEAIAWLQDNDVDVIVTDLCMPATDGMELLIALRKNKTTTPIIVISGGVAGTMSSMLRAAQLLGARHALEKPFPLQHLVDAIREALRPA